MLNSYMNKLTDVYASDIYTIKAIGVLKENGKKNMRLHILNNENNIHGTIEISRTDIDCLSDLQNYMDLDIRDIREIKRILKTCWHTLPQICENKNLGFQRNCDKITGYMGAKCFDGSGNKLIKDELASLPQCSGSISDVVNHLNRYMVKNIKREICLSHSLSGAVCGLLHRNIILAVTGESSKGKTTALKMGASFFAQSDYKSTILKWSATQNALVKRMDGLSGVNVLIDDTQLSKIKKFDPIIYSFESGQSIDRLVKGNELCDSYNWSVSIGITAEKSLLDTFDNRGAVARIIEMPVYKNDLFDDVGEVRDMQNLYSENYGVTGTAFIRFLLSCYGKDKIADMVKNEGQRACSVFGARLNENTILKRHLENDIAIMVVTAKLANQCLGFSFHVPLLRSALLGLCEENYRTFEQNTFEYVVTNTMYNELLAYAREHFPQNEKNAKIVIPSDTMKTFLSKYAKELKVNAAKIKDELSTHGLLSERDGTYCWNHTIEGKSITGYELIITERKD